MAGFTDPVRTRLAAIGERQSPRAKQWILVGALAGGVVAILWVVFAASSDDGARRAAAAAARSDVKPTNVDLMAPGAQVKDSEVWIGKAGRELERYRAERDEQARLNREMGEKQTELLGRLAQMEERLKARADEAAAAPPMPIPMPPAAALPPPPAAHPGAAMPPGVPALASPAAVPALPPRPQLVRVTMPGARTGADNGAVAAVPDAIEPAGTARRGARDTLDTFLPVSFTRGVLLGGLDAPTGGQAQGNPHPVLIRLSDNSVLPNRFRGEYRECFVIAAGYGDISAERAYLRTELLSCVRPDGEPLQVQIQGSVFGEDGKVGMRGRLVTKQGQMLANSLLAGVIGGIGQGFTMANTSFSTSPLGTVGTISGADAYIAGVGNGVGKAMDRLAQYYIKLAEQTFPIIEIDAGREVDVVLTKGVRIESGGAGPVAPASDPSRPDPAQRHQSYQRVPHDED